MHKRLFDRRQRSGIRVRPQHEYLYRVGDVLQTERPKRLESYAQTTVHVIAHRTRHADTTWRAFRLQPCCHFHHVTVDVGAVGNDIANVDADAKSDSSVRSHLAIKDRYLLLHSQRTPHRAIDTVEHHEQRVATGVDY